MFNFLIILHFYFLFIFHLVPFFRNQFTIDFFSCYKWPFNNSIPCIGSIVWIKIAILFCQNKKCFPSNNGGRLRETPSSKVICLEPILKICDLEQLPRCSSDINWKRWLNSQTKREVNWFWNQIRIKIEF